MLPAKNESSIYNISSEKVVLSELEEKYAKTRHSLQVKTVQNKYVGEFGCERKTGDGLFHYRKCYYELWNDILARIGSFKLKTS